MGHEKNPNIGAKIALNLQLNFKLKVKKQLWCSKLLLEVLVARCESGELLKDLMEDIHQLTARHFHYELRDSPNQVLTRTTWRGCFAAAAFSFTAVVHSTRGLWLEQLRDAAEINFHFQQ